MTHANNAGRIQVSKAATVGAASECAHLPGVVAIPGGVEAAGGEHVWEGIGAEALVVRAVQADGDGVCGVRECQRPGKLSFEGIAVGVDRCPGGRRLRV